jgi:hypothetical protein
MAMKMFEEWANQFNTYMKLGSDERFHARKGWQAAQDELAPILAEVIELKEKLAGDEQRVKDISRLTVERDEALEKIERVKGLAEKWRAEYKVPADGKGTTFVSDTADALADQLLAALEEKR